MNVRLMTELSYLQAYLTHHYLVPLHLSFRSKLPHGKFTNGNWQVHKCDRF